GLGVCGGRRGRQGVGEERGGGGHVDGHYEQVMAARERLADGPPRAYFAYSTVLDPAAFDEWRHQHGYDFFQLPPGTRAEALDLALVYDFPSRWWGGRVAGLEDRPGGTVHRLGFEIAPKDRPIIPPKEGAIPPLSLPPPG